MNGYHFRFIPHGRLVLLIVASICIACIVMPVAIFEADAMSEQANLIPEDFNFRTNHSCSGHDYFMQFSVGNDGRILLVSRYTDVLENKALTFKQCYVDVFEADGTHVVEFSFFTKDAFVAELNDTNVMLYFYDRIFEIDLQTETLQAKMTVPGKAVEDGTFDRLQRSKIKVGDSTYIARRGFQGYTKLIRDSGKEKTTLFSFDGIGYNWGYTALSTVALSAFLFLIRSHKKKKG